MTATGGVTTGGEPTWFRQLAVNASATLATLLRKPRVPATCRPSWRNPGRLVAILAVTVVAIAFAMAFVDNRTALAARNLPPRLVEAFDEITDYGKGVWLLVPIG